MLEGLNAIDEVAAAPRTLSLGVEQPACFTDAKREEEAVRSAVGVFDASFRRWVRLTGADRVSFLHGMLSADVRRLEAGQGAPAAILTQQGKVVSDLRVYAAADHFLLDLPAAGAAAAQAALEKFIVADDVELSGAGTSLIGLEGPDLHHLLPRLGAPAPVHRFMRAEATLAGHGVVLAGASHAGETGVVIGCAPEDVAAVWNACRQGGATAVGSEAPEVLRVEAGIPALGVDMDDGTLVMEVGIDDAISHSKGCYVGQEVVERVISRGHVNRLRVALRVDGDPLPAGAVLWAGEREVGRVTSCVRSARLGGTVGMGYVRREHASPGTALEAAAGETRAGVRVAALPLYAPPAAA